MGKFSPKAHDRLLVQDRDGFVQATGQMLARIEELRARGAREEMVLLLRLRLQAEISVRFPRAAMRAKAEEDWHAAASKMVQAKTPPEEIRKYLRKKAMDYREPNALELKAYSDKAALQVAAFGAITFETVVAVLAEEAEKMAVTAAAKT